MNKSEIRWLRARMCGCVPTHGGAMCINKRKERTITSFMWVSFCRFEDEGRICSMLSFHFLRRHCGFLPRKTSRQIPAQTILI